jgi:hypothetical protein
LVSSSTWWYLEVFNESQWNLITFYKILAFKHKISWAVYHNFCGIELFGNNQMVCGGQKAESLALLWIQAKKITEWQTIYLTNCHKIESLPSHQPSTFYSRIKRSAVKVIAARQRHQLVWKHLKIILNSSVLKNEIKLLGWCMDKLQLTGQDLGWVFNSKSVWLNVVQFHCFPTRLPTLKLRPKNF